MEAKHECDNCGGIYSEAEMLEIQHLEQRIDTGGIVPSGECPNCGCLCYLIGKKPPKAPKFPSWDTLKAYEVIFYPNHFTVVTDCKDVDFENEVDEWSAQHNSGGITIEEHLRNRGYFAVTGESTDIKITIA